MEAMPQRLLVIGAGPLQAPGIETGRRMGLEVIATDMDPEAPGAALADRFYAVSTIDVAATLEVARACSVDAVMTLGTDFPMRTVAEVARALALPGVSPETAEAATDKYEMCRRFDAHGAACPAFRLVSSAEEAQAALGDLGLPMILKPTDRSGSAGVALVRAEAQVAAGFARAHGESRAGKVLAEEYVSGREISVETMSHGGEFHVVAITDKLTTGPPGFVELGHVVPCELDERTAAVVRETARRGVEALGIECGPTHTEMKIDGERVVIIEIGARLGGDRITSHLVPLATGVDLVEASIRVALGEEPDLTPTLDRAAAIRYMQPPPGRVRTVRGARTAREMPGVVDLDVEVGPGDTVSEVRSSGDRPAWVIAVGEGASEAIARAESARDAVRIETVPQEADGA